MSHLSNAVLVGFRYREIDESSELIQWFWEVLESFTNDERILFMRFVSGRSRLPANPADISQRFQIMKVDRVRVLCFQSTTHQCLHIQWSRHVLNILHRVVVS